MEDIKLYEKLQSDLTDCSRRITQKAVKIGEMFSFRSYSDFVDQVADCIYTNHENLELELKDDSRYSDLGDKYYLTVPLKYFEMTEEELQVSFEEYKFEKINEEKEHEAMQKITLKIALETQIEKAKARLAELDKEI